MKVPLNTLGAVLLHNGYVNALVTKRAPTIELSQKAGPFMGVNFPDPGVIKGPSGPWKAYGTSSNGKNIPIATSDDILSGWTLTDKDALPDPGSWVEGNNGIWGPDVIFNVCKLC